MPRVTVPCSVCSTPLGFGELVCRSCGTLLSRELRDALEARLEASDADYRELKQATRSATTVVLILGLLHLGMGIWLYVVGRTAVVAPSGDDATVALASLIVDSAIGVAMLGCAAWSRRSPVVALGTALAIWVGVHVLATLVSPLTILAGLLFKCLVLMLLGRGIYSAWRAAALMRKLGGVK